MSLIGDLKGFTKTTIVMLIVAVIALLVSIIAPGMLILYLYKPEFVLNASLAKVSLLSACFTLPFFSINSYLCGLIYREFMNDTKNPDLIRFVIDYGDEMIAAYGSTITSLIYLPWIYLAYVLSLRFSFMSLFICLTEAAFLGFVAYLFKRIEKSKEQAQASGDLSE